MNAVVMPRRRSAVRSSYRGAAQREFSERPEAFSRSPRMIGEAPGFVRGTWRAVGIILLVKELGDMPGWRVRDGHAMLLYRERSVVRAWRPLVRRTLRMAP